MALDLKVFLLITGIYIGFDKSMLLVYNSNTDSERSAIIHKENIIMQTKSKSKVKYNIGLAEIEILVDGYKQIFFLDTSKQIITRKFYVDNSEKYKYDTIVYSYSGDTLKFKSNFNKIKYSILNKNRGIVQYYNFSFYDVDKISTEHLYLYDNKLIVNSFDDNNSLAYPIENLVFPETCQIPIYKNEIYKLNRRKNKVYRYIYTNYRIIGNEK